MSDIEMQRVIDETKAAIRAAFERFRDEKCRPRARDMPDVLARLDKLEIALHRIAGHGNITAEKAREIAAEAVRKD